MAIETGKRSGRGRGKTATNQSAKIKLSNVNLTDAAKFSTLWFEDATSGDYKLTYAANESAAIDYADNAAAVEVHIEAITGITAVTVTGAGTKKNPFKILFVTPSSSFGAFTVSDNSLLAAWSDADRA